MIVDTQFTTANTLDPWGSAFSSTAMTGGNFVAFRTYETEAQRTLREFREAAKHNAHVRAVLRSARRPDVVPPPAPLAPVANPPPVLLVRSRGQAPRRAA